MDSQVRFELSREANYFYFSLFRREAPSGLIENYLEVHELFHEFKDMPACELMTLRTIISNRLDAPAVELWLRRSGKRHALSAKLLLVMYLAEAGGSSISLLRHVGPPHRWGVLFFSIIGGVARLFLGFYLKIRYGLV